jgi:hypothetical protein
MYQWLHRQLYFSINDFIYQFFKVNDTFLVFTAVTFYFWHKLLFITGTLHLFFGQRIHCTSVHVFLCTENNGLLISKEYKKDNWFLSSLEMYTCTRTTYIKRNAVVIMVMPIKFCMCHVQCFRSALVICGYWSGYSADPDSNKIWTKF